MDVCYAPHCLIRLYVIRPNRFFRYFSPDRVFSDIIRINICIIGIVSFDSKSFWSHPSMPPRLPPPKRLLTVTYRAFSVVQRSAVLWLLSWLCRLRGKCHFNVHATHLDLVASSYMSEYKSILFFTALSIFLSLRIWCRAKKDWIISVLIFYGFYWSSSLEVVKRIEITIKHDRWHPCLKNENKPVLKIT